MKQLLLALLVLVGGPTAFASIPPDQQASVEHVLALIGALSTLLAGARPLLNLIPPTSRWRVVAEVLDKGLHYLAGNTKPLDARVTPLKRPSGPPYGFGALLALALLLTACAGSLEQRTRTTLDAISVVVDPAYAAAMDGCIASERAVLETARVQGYKPAYSEQFEQASARCHQVRIAFEAIRALHDEAAHQLEAGAIREAQATIQRLLAAWRALKGGSGGEAG